MRIILLLSFACEKSKAPVPRPAESLLCRNTLTTLRRGHGEGSHFGTCAQTPPRLCTLMHTCVWGRDKCTCTCIGETTGLEFPVSLTVDTNPRGLPESYVISKDSHRNFSTVKHFLHKVKLHIWIDKGSLSSVIRRGSQGHTTVPS